MVIWVMGLLVDWMVRDVAAGLGEMVMLLAAEVTIFTLSGHPITVIV